ncbi:MAG TPA: aldo/keto reductase [Mycetocola sp.]|jgi:2,5-diketo-D-gluconate reductase A|uniref:aldo/keto reductase n=1 Tax=Mycetocola sp. TaxID=1871042 RepID=UPI002624CDB3|nr:aldo/keto reductase [Mycetocola sp.]MCU1559149.1 aldo/keto reductase [Mycetocola sp.]HEV7849239.1 aldo/keto reductase [Mycetocola sp.]
MSISHAYPLNDGQSIPAIGFGTYPMKGQEATDAVANALDIGYRLIDTAVNYRNEEAVGRAIAGSDVPRSEITLATKLPGRDHGYDETLRSFDASCAALGVDVIDLYLIHWPNPRVGRYTESWKAMVQLQKDSRVRSIGVSNFTPEFIERLDAETGVLPAVNQVELHPYFPQEALVAFHAERGIITEAWSPLGKRAAPYQEPVVGDIAAAHGISASQVVLRWHQMRGVVPIPKSADPERQRSNFEIPPVELEAAEIAAITALGHADGRLFGGNPETHEEM